MPELPDRPDVDQLRHQARELLRAAARGESSAVARLGAVSDRLILSAAQLAVAREYGFPSWPAMKAVAERRRSAVLAAGTPPAGGDGPGAAPRLEERRSFGGGGPVETADGTLLPDLLIAGPGRATLHARLALSASAARPGASPSGLAAQRGAPLSHEERLALARRLAAMEPPRLDDITVTDDRDARYALWLEGMVDGRHQADAAARPSSMEIRVEPVPEPGAAWFELRHRSGSATRLLPSPQPVMRVSPVTPTAAGPAERKLDGLARWLIELRLADPSGDLARPRATALAQVAELQSAGVLADGSDLAGQLARLCAAITGDQQAAGLPPAWSGMLKAAGRADGARLRLDLGAAVPVLAGVVTRLDSLVSGPESWRLFLRAAPGWFAYAEDGRSKRAPVSVAAADDLGGSYVSGFGGSSGHGGLDEVTLAFRPRLDPLARRLTLTLRGDAEEVAVVVDLPPAGPGG
jgi:hypothetical protein